MDFIDFESYADDLPQPQPALSLPIASNIESITKHFNLNLSVPKNDQPEEDAVAKKYASLLLSLLKETPTNNDPVVSPTSLSTRLSRVLNTPLLDAAIRDIFATLEARTDNIANLVEPGVVGLLARRQFRGTVESDLIRSQSLLLKEYQPVIRQLQKLQDRVANLNNLHDLAVAKIASGMASTEKLSSAVSSLRSEKNSLHLKKELLASFRKNFTLNEYEHHVLELGDINDEFFDVLRRAELISDRCSILLSIDNPQLGLKIMNQVNGVVSKALDRIVSYTNKTLANLYSLTTRSRLETLHRCLRYLKTKMTFFSSIVNGFVESRSKVIVDEFLVQVNGDLDRLEDSVSGRPLVLSAHDPLRFVGDVLAYVHSVVVNENELIRSIFALDLESADETSEFDAIAADVTLKALTALARPIRSKLDQVVLSEFNLLTLYQLFNLLDLYAIMFTKQLPRGELIATLQDLIKLAQDKITGIVKNRLVAIRSSNSAQLDITPDLQPPEWIIEFYFDILPILDQVHTETVMNLPNNQHASFLRLIVNEPIDIFTSHVASTKSLSQRDQLILKQNFLDLVLSKIMPLSILSDKTIEVSDLMAELTTSLTTHQLLSLFGECGLTNYYNIVNMICPFDTDFDVAVYQPITENKLFTKDLLTEVNEKLQQFLPTALLDIQQSLLKINSPMIVNEIITNLLIEFVKFYKYFGRVVEEYLEPIFVWTDHEVATLLGVEQTYEGEHLLTT